MILRDLLQLVLFIGLLAALSPLLGRYVHQVFSGRRTFLHPVLGPVERGVYSLSGIHPDENQTWSRYAVSLIGFSLAGFLLTFGVLLFQDKLPLNPQGFPGLSWDLALNTAVSFLTNTNWQSYGGETTMSHFSQMVALTYQNFVSAAVGIAVCAAVVRGIARNESSSIGNFWSDLVRITLYVLLPLSIIGALIMLWQGMVQNFDAGVTATTLEGGKQFIATGPVASQIAIKLLGTNGGGFFNANSSHPYENPNMWTNLIEILLMLAIPVALTRTFGRMIGNIRQGYALLGAMVVLFGISFFAVVSFESFVDDPLTSLTGGSMEGKEDRFGIVWSALFGTTSTSTSTGAVNSMHDSYTALGGMMYMFNMMLGEVSPGGVGAGLYGILVMAVVAVFIAGLMVGRTPEYLGKKIGPREMKMASLYFLVMPVTVVLFVALSFAIPGIREDTFAALNNSGNHGLSEVVYAFVSGANNNGSAFAGLSADTPWLDTMIGLAMLIGRFLPIMLVLSLAGSLAKQDVVPETAGTMKTDNKLFVGLLVFVIFIISALTFFPTLALGPLAEGLVA